MALGEEFDFVLADDFQRGFGEGSHFDEPLIGEVGLDGGFGAVGVANLCFVGFFFF